MEAKHCVLSSARDTTSSDAFATACTLSWAASCRLASASCLSDPTPSTPGAAQLIIGAEGGLGAGAAVAWLETAATSSKPTEPIRVPRMNVQHTKSYQEK
eukprot:6195037-Pleurochrysis_carterae.AAC.6